MLPCFLLKLFIIYNYYKSYLYSLKSLEVNEPFSFVNLKCKNFPSSPCTENFTIEVPETI